MYDDIKTGLSDLLHISKDALHIHLGLAIFFGLALLLRKSPASWLPWLGLLAFELLNEFIDGYHFRAMQLDVDVPGALLDIGNTMLWPTLALIFFRLLRRRQQPTIPEGTN
jgi:hypothetical protein